MAELQNIHLEREMLGLSKRMSELMRNNAPVDTGALKRSIKVQPLIETPKGLTEPISFLYYGAIQNSPGYKHTGWIDKAQERALDQKMPDVADGAAHDMADTIGGMLPNQINLTLDL